MAAAFFAQLRDSPLEIEIVLQLGVGERVNASDGANLNFGEKQEGEEMIITVFLAHHE